MQPYLCRLIQAIPFIFTQEYGVDEFYKLARVRTLPNIAADKAKINTRHHLPELS